MTRERIIWIVALFLVAGATYFGSQAFGGRGGFAGRNGGGTAGTVSAIAGNVVTLSTRDGRTIQVQLDANTALRKQVDGQLSDLKTGEQIVAIGTLNGNTMQATNVQIGGGFGGQNGGARAGAAAP